MWPRVRLRRNLPHDLVASFRSTLDEALDASLLLHVVVASIVALSHSSHARSSREYRRRTTSFASHPQQDRCRRSRARGTSEKRVSRCHSHVRTQSQGHRGAVRASCKVLSRQHDPSRSPGFLRQGRSARRDPQKRSRAKRVLRRKRRVSHDQSNSRYPCRSKAAARRIDPCCAVSRSHRCIDRA
ncbi:MAG: hypothetical protein DMG16_26535 [Acidobacteria bacterium]|nr:MAG: hypothetical protein DMG16_26535 [Acidobacteriota bacterium]